MGKAEIITYHGWGFDADCWEPWQNIVPTGMEWINFDRGYFRNPQPADFSGEDGQKIVFTHSFGLHLCSEAVLEMADRLVIFSGFISFHPQAAQFRRRSKQVVNEMIEQFEEHPDKVLKAFYRNVYHPEKEYRIPRKAINKSLLLQDLKKLNSSTLQFPDLKSTAKVLIFHGTDDAIVPKRQGRSLYENLGSKAQYFEIKQSGHALPMTHASKCWQMIEPNIL